MTTTLTKARAPKAAAPLAPGLPQVNLLPPEVRAARGLVNVKRWLGLSLIFVVVAAALVFGFAVLENSSAQDELAQAQADNARLVQEQQTYAEVPAVLGELKRAEDARTIGMATDVLWKPYIDAIAAVLPAGVSIDTFTMSQATPWAPTVTTSDPLLDPGLGSIQFTARAATLPDDAAWLDALNTVPGFGGATISAAAVTQAEGAPYYQITSSVQVHPSALSLRFVPTEEN